MSTLKFNKWQSIDGVTRNAVLQVVQGSISTEFTTTSISPVDTGLYAEITPSSTTSKIFILVTFAVEVTRASQGQYSNLNIYRNDTTNLYGLGGSTGSTTALATTGTNIFRDAVTLSYYDSPSTTNSVKYSLYGSVNVAANSGTAIFFRNNTPAYITLMEIAQ
jgi:hypothetical protein